jgi:hypothetical protein
LPGGGQRNIRILTDDDRLFTAEFHDRLLGRLARDPHDFLAGLAAAGEPDHVDAGMSGQRFSH